MEKINVAELLRNCPKGMELDCTMFEGVYFDHVDDLRHNSIKCYVNNGNEHFEIALDEHGQYISNKSAKCVIFPKGKTTWEGFQRPFKDGDILYVDCTDESDDEQHEYIFILNRIYNGEVHSYCHYFMLHDSFHPRTTYLTDNEYPIRFATEEEKQKLFQAIKDNGYKWNPDDKTLEKIDYQYPKTYEECCDVLGRTLIDDYVEGYKWKLMMSFQKLLICRDAYWKIAGEQMGLGKPWEPDWVNAIYTCTIICRSNKIVKDAGFDADNRILAFPTEEMRDAFYENFKDLIEYCKYFL